MSAATSPGTGLAYGLRRVCAAWGGYNFAAARALGTPTGPA